MYQELILSFWIINIVIVCFIFFISLFRNILNAEISFFLMIGLIGLNKIIHVLISKKLFLKGEERLSYKASGSIHDLKNKILIQRKDDNYE